MDGTKADGPGALCYCGFLNEEIVEVEVTDDPQNTRDEIVHEVGVSVEAQNGSAFAEAETKNYEVQNFEVTVTKRWAGDDVKEARVWRRCV